MPKVLRAKLVATLDPQSAQPLVTKRKRANAETLAAIAAVRRDDTIKAGRTVESVMAALDADD